jgi:hypothetical protein
VSLLVPHGPHPTSHSRRAFLKTLLSATAASGVRLPFATALATPEFPFDEVPPSKSGITWVHQSGMSSEKYLPETTGSGCAFLDYDNDGWMDIYLVNGGKCDFYDPNPPLRNALYRNNRDGTFTDVTEKAGVGAGGFGMGVAVGDYNADGFPDLYVTQYGRSILYRNNGDGTFTDVTEKAGLAAPGWAASAVWFDYDNDGRLDLFVCRFADFSKVNHRHCSSIPGKNEYCVPRAFGAMPSWLFHNNGDGTFTDVSEVTGIAVPRGKAWGVVAADLNNDGRTDLFVSNDTVGNFLFMNRGNNKFEEIGESAGVAFSADGRPRSGMGVDAADFNDDGWMDLFVSNLDKEIFSIYKNNRDETFDDEAARSEIGPATRFMSGWGLKFFDYDNDGNLDLLLGNGEPDDFIHELDPRVTYREPLGLFHKTDAGFKNVSSEAGPVFQRMMSARGLAIGDFNNDGAQDVLISCSNEPPVLLQNHAGRHNHWLGVKLIGKKANIDAVGAIVTYQAGDLKRSRMKVGGGSFLSSHDPRMVFGLGQRTKLDWIEIKWPQPSGLIQRLTDLPIDRYVTIREGHDHWE